MTVIGMLMLVLGIIVVGSLAYWIITKFLPPNVHMISLAVVGVLLLLVLIYAVFPGSLGNHVF